MSYTYTCMHYVLLQNTFVFIQNDRRDMNRYITPRVTYDHVNQEGEERVLTYHKIVYLHSIK